jgi:release factor glutamine methyltransferase
MATIKELLVLGRHQLATHQVPYPQDTAACLLAHLLRQDRIFLLTHDQDLVAPALIATYQEYLTRRCQGEPLQYIRGYQEFYGREFSVTPDVLIPRPETEFIIETALQLVSTQLSNPGRCVQILDLCTGSGCIAITLAAELPMATIVATDISHAALKVAQFNAQRHNVTTQIHWLVTNLSSALLAQPFFDICCANPPYIAVADRETLPPEVHYEPDLALFADQAGTAIIQEIIQQAVSLVKPHGYLLCEIGYGQESIVQQQIDRNYWQIQPTINDLQQIPRIIVLQRRADTVGD